MGKAAWSYWGLRYFADLVAGILGAEVSIDNRVLAWSGPASESVIAPCIPQSSTTRATLWFREMLEPTYSLASAMDGKGDDIANHKATPGAKLPTNSQLKEMLKEAGLQVSGNKAELISRLCQALSTDLLKVSQLKEMLKKADLRIDGRKVELVARLLNVLTKTMEK